MDEPTPTPEQASPPEQATSAEPAPTPQPATSAEPAPTPQHAPAPQPAPSPPPAATGEAGPAPEPGAPPAPTLDLDAVAADLAAVEAALARLDEGTYGRCEACGGPIDEETLEARPTAATCAAHLPTL